MLHIYAIAKQYYIDEADRLGIADEIVNGGTIERDMWAAIDAKDMIAQNTQRKTQSTEPVIADELPVIIAKKASQKDEQQVRASGISANVLVI